MYRQWGEEKNKWWIFIYTVVNTNDESRIWWLAKNACRDKERGLNINVISSPGTRLLHYQYVNIAAGEDKQRSFLQEILPAADIA